MNLYLIGFRGSGKTTVAPLIAHALGWNFIDSDRQIEKLAGRPIDQIFRDEGESGFRRQEIDVVAALTRSDQLVVAFGGGVPTIAENRMAIRNTGRSVWLTASPEILWQRVGSDSRTPHQRPGLTDLDGFDEVLHLLRERDSAYRTCADYTVDTTNLDPQQLADHIVDWWQSVDR